MTGASQRQMELPDEGRPLLSTALTVTLFLQIERVFLIALYVPLRPLMVGWTCVVNISVVNSSRTSCNKAVRIVNIPEEIDISDCDLELAQRM
eukprot:IDg22754t1